MFRRIPWDEMISDIRIAGLFLLGVGSILLVARLLRMKRDEIDRRASMPLDSE